MCFKDDNKIKNFIKSLYSSLELQAREKDNKDFFILRKNYTVNNTFC